MIIKRGDVLRTIKIIKEGIVEVLVPYKERLIHFDYLPPGSCISCFTSFGDELQSVLHFKAKTNCVIYSLDVKNDLIPMGKKDNQIKNVVKSIQQQAASDMLTPFDFFRFNPKLLDLRYRVKKSSKDDFQIGLSPRSVNNIKADLKRKVIGVFKKFIKDYKMGKVKMPIALIAIRFLEEHRKMKKASILNAGLDQGSPQEI